MKLRQEFENWIELNFNQIKNGDRINIDKIPFKLSDYDFFIRYYEEIEEFEKCRIILTERDNIMNHDNNYILKNI